MWLKDPEGPEWAKKGGYASRAPRGTLLQPLPVTGAFGCGGPKGPGRWCTL
jgi:hypothetical protein